MFLCYLQRNVRGGYLHLNAPALNGILIDG